LRSGSSSRWLISSGWAPIGHGGVGIGCNSCLRGHSSRPTPEGAIWNSIEGERIGDWIKVPLAEPLAWISGIWYPKKRSKKILLDAVQSLLTLADKLEEDPNLIKITLPYLLLLHIVNEIPKPPGVLLRQFQVRESYGWFTEREPRILLQSEAHAV
jgi:hypothetical protein